MSSPSREIDAVVVDLGNVLVLWDPYLPFVGRMTRGDAGSEISTVYTPALVAKIGETV